MTKQMASVMVWAAVAAVAIPAVAQGQAAQQSAGTGGIQVQQEDRYVVGRALPPETPGAQRVDLTLEQAIERALDKNLDIKNAKLTPQMQDYSLQAARAVFRPTVTGSYSYNNSSQLGSTQFEGSRTTTQSNSLGGSISKRMPWQGAQVSINMSNSRTATDNPFSTNNPSLRTGLTLQYTQPLLAGRKMDGQRNALVSGEITRQITDIALLAQIENIKNQVRVAYWSLRQSIEAIEIQRRALDLSKRSYDDNKTKVEVGTVAEIDLVQLESAIASGEQVLLDREISWRNAEIAFKRLLVDSTADDFFRATINPTDLPTIEVQNVDIPAAVTRAIAQRSDIETARQNLKITEMSLALSKNQTMPSLNLNTSYALSGTGGNRYNSSGALLSQLSYLDALREVGRLDTPTWQLSLSFNKPLGLSAQKANHLRSELQFEQQKTTMKATELNIETAVTRAGLDVQSSYKQLLASQKSREAAERTLQAELTRFSVGMSTNYQVIQFQNALTQSRNSELSATIRYINAIAEFDRVQRIQ